MAVYLLGDAARSALPLGVGLAATLAFAYSLWTIAGGSKETIVGLPVYVVVVRVDASCHTREPRFCNLPSRIVIAGVRPHRAQPAAAFGKIV